MSVQFLVHEDGDSVGVMRVNARADGVQADGA